MAELDESLLNNVNNSISDPFFSRVQPAAPTTFQQNVFDAISNTVFNVIDSAAFGVPSMLMNKNIQTERKDFYSSKKTYGDFFESMGIKPYERLTTGGKIGYGTGQALGFFIPMSGITKVSKGIQAATIGNVGRLIDDVSVSAVRNIDALNSAEKSTKAVTAAINKSLLKRKSQISPIYRSTQEELLKFENDLTIELSSGITNALKSSGFNANSQMTEGIVSNVIKSMRANTKGAKYYDDIEGMIYKFGLDAFGNSKTARVASAYISRAIDNTVNMFFYDSVSKIVRNAAGAKEDYNVGESLGESAKFMMVMSLADFIPGGKKASSIADMRKLMSSATKRTTSFADDFAKGKITQDELAKLATFYSRLGKTTLKGNKEVSFHSMHGKKLAEYLDNLYNTTRNELGGLTGQIAKETAKSIFGSIPRGVADALLTAGYLSGDGVPIFDRLNDESQLADILIGAFMAARNYDNPIRTNADGTFKETRYRYNTGIGSKLEMLEYMGMDVGSIKTMIGGLSEYEKNLYNTYRTKQSLQETEQFNSVFKEVADRKNKKTEFSTEADKELTGSATDKFDDKETRRKRKWINHFYQEFYQASVLVKNPEILNDPSLIANNKDFFNVYGLSKEEVDDIYDKLSKIQITGGGTSKTTINDYDNFNEFLEAYYSPIVNGNKDVILKYIREYGESIGINVIDSTDGKLIIDNFVLDENVNNESALHLSRIIEDGIESGWILKSNTQTKTISIDDTKKEQISDIESRLNDETQELFNGSFAYAPSENPALSMISSYSALKASNRFMRIIKNKQSESDNIQLDNELRETLSSLLSLKDGKIGLGDFSIDLDGKEVDADELSSLNLFLNGLINLKKSTGQITSDTKNKKVSYDSLKRLKEKMEEQSIYSDAYSNDGIIQFGGITLDELKKELISDSIEDTDLDYRDYVAISMLKDSYGTGENGKIRIPNDANQLVALSKDIKDTATKQELIDFYSKEVLPRIQKFTDFIEVVPDNLEQSQKMNALETIAALKAIYSTESALELYDLSKSNVIKNYNDILDNAYSTLSSEKSSSNVLTYLTDNIEIINNVLKNTLDKTSKEMLDQLIDATKNGVSDNEKLLSLIDNLRKDAKQRLSISEMTSMLINSYDEKFASESYSSFIVHSRLRQSLQDLIKKSNSDIKIDNDSILELFFKAMDTGDYARVEEIIKEAIALKSQVSKISDVSIYREVTENSLRNTLERFQSHNSEVAKQSIISKLKNSPEGSAILNLENSDFSDKFKENYLKDRKSTIDNLFDIMTKTGMYNVRDAKDGIIKIIHSLEQTNITRKVARVDNGRIVYDDAVKGKETRLNQFINTRLGFLNAFSLKNTIIDQNGKAGSLTSLRSNDDSKRELSSEMDISNYLSGLKSESSFERTGSREIDMNKAINLSPVTNLNKVFVYLQNAEEVGIVFDLTQESFDNLKLQFKEFYDSELSKLSGSRLDNFRRMFSHLNDSEIKDFNAIASMVRALYYKDFLGDSFHRVFDSNDKDDISKLQKKVMKYVHVTNNKNPIIITKESADALQHVLRMSGTKTDIDAANAIERISRNGYRISFYKDEFKKTDGHYHTQDAFAVVRESVKRIFPNASQQEIDLALKETTSEMSNLAQEIATLEQSSMDGAVIVSASVAKMAIRSMGADFDGGQTAFKGVIYNNKNMNGEDKAILGKQALKYHPALSELMDRLGIDILMPSTSSKIVSESLLKVANSSFDPNKSLQDNFNEQFLRSLSYDNYSIETLQLLFPERKRHASNRNSSVTHGFDLEALKSYYETIDIESVVSDIATSADLIRKSYNGYKSILLEKYNEISDNYSDMSAVEKLLKWGLETNSTFVQTQVLRMFSKSTQDRLISMPSNKIANSLVFVDTRLSSPIIRNNGSPRDQFIQRYGETRLSHYDKKIELSGDENIIFSLGSGVNNLQDYVISMKNPDDYFSANTKNGTSINKDTLKAIQNVIKWAKSLAKNQGHLHFLLSSVSRDINKLKNGIGFYNKIYDTNGITIINDIAKLANSDVGDFAIALNNHKVPKKHFADSVVSRLKGFNPESYGSSIYTNHYDIAVPHQADQDGDKLTVYTAMPFSVIKNSTERMTLVKGFSSKGNFQQPVRLNLFGKDDYKSFEHYRNIKKAAFAIGSTVRLLGGLSMMNNLDLKINNKNLMGSIIYGNDAVNFNQRLFSIVQSILDYHGGVPEEFLNKQLVRNFLLFGEDMGLANKTEYEDGTFNGIFNVKDILNELGEAGNDIHSERIVKDYISEMFSLMEDVYSSVQDQYDDGVQTPLTFEQKQYILSRFNRFKDNPNSYIYSQLRYKYRKSPEVLKSLNLIVGGKSSENISQRAIISNLSDFKNKIMLLEKYYPQLRILSEVVKNGDILKSNDTTIYEKSKEYELLSDLSKNKLDNMIELGDDEDFLYSQFFIKDLAEKQEYNVENVNNAFMLNSFLNKRLSKLKSLRDFYLSNGDNDKYEYFNELVNSAEDKISSLTNVLKSYTDKSTKSFYIKDSAGTISNKKDSGKLIYVYKVVDNEIQFVKSLRPGQYLKSYGKENYIVSLDPFKPVNPDSKEAQEGWAMEMSTVNFPSLLKNDEKIIGSIKSVISELKSSLYNITSDAMNDFGNSKAKMNDIFEARALAEKNAFDTFAFKIKEIERTFNIGANSKINVDDFYLAVAKMMLRPKLSTVEFIKTKNVEVPFFKNNSKLPMQLARALNSNSETAINLNVAIQEVFKLYSSNINNSNGYFTDTNDLSGNRDYRMMKENPSEFSFRKTFIQKRFPGLNYDLNKAYRESDYGSSYSVENGTVYYEYYKNLDNNKLSCGR